MKKNFLHCLLFLTGLLVLLLLLSKPFQKLQYPEDPAIMLEPADTIDAIFIGNSECLYAFSPVQIWQEYGISSFNCGTNNQKPYRTEDLLRIMFTTQHPKIVVMEPHMLFVPHYWYESYIPILGMYLPVIRNHDQWKPLQWRHWFRETEPMSVDPAKGYTFSSDSLPPTNTEYMVFTDTIKPVNSWDVYRVHQIKKLCDKNNAQLVLVSVPSALNWSYPCHNGVQAFADELGVPYIDLNLLTDEVPIDWSKDTKDHGDHLNSYGAQKVTAYMGKYLQNTGLFHDKRTSPDYAHWNTLIQ